MSAKVGEDQFDGYASLCNLVVPATISPTIQADPVDDMVPATALAAQVDAIVTRDNAVLNVKQFHGIDVLNSIETLRLLEAPNNKGQ